MFQIIYILTLGLLATFSLIYVSSAIKSPVVEKIMGVLRPLVDNLSVAGVAVGFLGACFMPIKVAIPKQMFVYMFADIVLLVLSLPYMLHKFERKLEGHTNAAILAELRTSLGFITNNEVIFGFIGAGAIVGVFVVPFI